VASRLLGNIAHDIRTPATVVRGYLRMLMDGRAGPITAAQQDCVELALSAAAKMDVLGANVEEAARSMEKISPESLDLRDVWSKVCQSSRPRALARALTIHESIPAERVPVSGDRAAITTLLEQLFAQALEKAEHNGEVRVAISDELGGATLKLSVPVRTAMERLDATEPAAVFSNLRNRFFIHGGTLLCWLKQGESATVTISLPSGRA
jgi:signal transduction histidine kinase